MSFKNRIKAAWYCLIGNGVVFNVTVSRLSFFNQNRTKVINVSAVDHPESKPDCFFYLDSCSLVDFDNVKSTPADYDLVSTQQPIDYMKYIEKAKS